YMIATIAGQGDEGIDEGNPREVIEIVKDMQVRGKRVLQIVYHPVSFDAKESRLSAAWMAQWHLSYSYPQALPTQDTHKPWEVEFAAAIPGVINATNAPLVAERDSENEKTEYVIVAHDAFYNAIQPLVKQKEAKGLRVTTIKLSEIAGGYTGDNGFIDNYSIETANMFADRITVYLRKLYDQRQDKPLYVLLVGDAQFVPPHYRTNHVNYIDSQESVAKKRVATDLYYGVFEQDDKGNYSIYTKYVPDLFVGRLPCKTAEECSVMVEKIVCMENNHSGSFDFSRNVLLAGSIASDAVSEYLSENGFQVNTSIAMNLDPAHYTLAAQPIIDAVNQGVGLVYYRGEGTKFSWSDPYFDSATQGMSIADLRNQERYPWIIAAASLTGRFDPLYEENNQMVIGNQDSFAESWLKAQGSGAYAVIAATHEQPTCLSSSFNAMPSYLISSDNQDARHFGALLQYSKMSTLHYLPYASDRMQRTAFELYQLFGDPEAGPLVEANSMLAKSN
ncbi:MAG: hypothetical protein KBA46_07505, partial [Candidatus Omnitrophica bacterium]|nr:hypothetical protein [Candidatus Omnitrophota bacterium]